MGESIRLIAQHYDNTTGKLLNSKEIYVKQVLQPNSIEKLGYTHAEQIKILQNSQDFYLEFQAKEINSIDNCPNCGKKLRKQGKFQSSFHALFTDHKLMIQRKTCTCNHSLPYTVEGIYGNSMHPALLEKQSLLGAEHSYKKAEKILFYDSCQHRTINNDDRISRSIELVAKELETIKLQEEWNKTEIKNKELILNVDGGHLQPNTKGCRSFEAMIATVYAPNNIKIIDKNHRQILNKTSVASAKLDKQVTIKKLTVNACKKQGLNKNTTIIALSDGAKNCWSIIDSVSEHCKKIIKILDWFHIGKKFKNTEHAIPKEHIELYEKAKWHLWHGKPDTALIRLQQVLDQTKIADDRKKITSLMKYIKNNAECIVNYHHRQLKDKPYTSNLAECSVNSLINARQKQNLKMQWSRKGAHDILQVRTSIFSNDWQEDWQKAKDNIYKLAA